MEISIEFYSIILVESNAVILSHYYNYSLYKIKNIHVKVFTDLIWWHRFSPVDTRIYFTFSETYNKKILLIVNKINYIIKQ